MFLITMSVAMSLLNSINMAIPDEPFFLMTAFGGFFWVVTVVLGLYIHVVALLMLNAYLQDQPVSLRTILADAYHLLPRVVRAWIVPFIKILVGFLLCIIPGIYLSYRYYFITHEIVFLDTPPDEAEKRSEIGTEGRKLDLFLLGILLGAIPYLIFTGISMAFYGFSFMDYAMDLGSGGLKATLLNLVTSFLVMPFTALLYIATTMIFLESLASRPPERMDERTDYPADLSAEY